MKKNLFTLSLLTLFAPSVQANPACIVCTFAIGASLSISRFLGVADNVIAIWLGAILALLGYWTILWFDKKNWNFPCRNYLLMLLSLALVSGVYIKDLTYMPKIIGFLYIDVFLFWTIVGSLIYILSQKLYEFMKRKNNGHAHFPFEKVVLPVTLLLIASVYVNNNISVIN